MSTSDLFKKHFPAETYGWHGVGLMHPNMEAFLSELNDECLQEDLVKKTKIEDQKINETCYGK